MTKKEELKRLQMVVIIIMLKMKKKQKNQFMFYKALKIKRISLFYLIIIVKYINRI